jgi:hypothetical protein
MDTPTNQIHVDVIKGVKGKRFDRGRARRGYGPIVLAAIEVKTI